MLRRQVWIANALLVTAVVGVVGAGVFGVVLYSAARARASVAAHPPRHVAPPVSGAYVQGGAPRADPALADLLHGPLTELVVETDRDRERGGMDAERRTQMLRDLGAPPAIVAHGPALASAWASMISALDRWVYVPRSGRDYDGVVDTFKDHVRAVSDQLAAAGLAYYLEGDIVTSGRAAHAVVYAYRVEEVVFVTTAGAPRRVLGLRRLDDLNFEHSMLGMQSEDLGDPVVLLDQIDDHVARRLVPLLAPDAGYPLGGRGARSDDELEPTRVLAGAAVRAELTGALGADRSREHLARLVAASIRRHEAQHGVDEDREAAGERRPYPAALAEHIGAADDAAGHPRNYVDHCRNELSAYASQLANDPLTPRTAYFQLVNFAFERRLWGTPESFAAVILSERLAAHLTPGGGPPLEVIHDGAIDRARLAGMARTVTAASPDALRAAARATWRDLYDEDYTPIVDR